MVSRSGLVRGAAPPHVRGRPAGPNPLSASQAQNLLNFANARKANSMSQAMADNLYNYAKNRRVRKVRVPKTGRRKGVRKAKPKCALPFWVKRHTRPCPKARRARAP